MDKLFKKKHRNRSVTQGYRQSSTPPVVKQFHQLPLKPRKDQLPTIHTIHLDSEVTVRALVLNHATSLEWSGYGLYRETESGDMHVVRLYVLSEHENDSHATTELTAMHYAQAVMLAMDDGYDLDEYRFAWVHRHPMSAFWSGTDLDAIEDALKMQQSEDATTVSIEFGSDIVIARRDTLGSYEDLNVTLEYGVNQPLYDKFKSPKNGSVHRPHLHGYDRVMNYGVCELCHEVGRLRTCGLCAAEVCENCLDSATPPICLECAHVGEMKCFTCAGDIEGHVNIVPGIDGMPDLALCDKCYDALYSVMESAYG